ncbi:MAG: hypothetical protein KF763_10970 [Cyclobacteriaceae bacterium]|nr:hypothetical protein [Cyclobacteriaceae bacterium]
MRLLVTIGLMLVAGLGISQTFSEKITREYSFEKKSGENAVLIANISGNITIAAYDGDKILLEVTRTIKGKTAERLEAGKQITMGVIDLADTLIFYTEGLCSKFGRKQNHKNNWSHTRGWGYDWNGRDPDDCREKVEYTLDYIVRVPKGTNLIVSTINNGNIKIDDVAGGIEAHNINGAIALNGISNAAVAHTINGNVEISYAKNPPQACRFYTLSGDIHAWFQKGLQAELSFESFNGQFFTNVASLQAMPVVVKKEESKEGLKFKIKGNQFKIGTGGVPLNFETFNGNVYLKEKS